MRNRIDIQPRHAALIVCTLGLVRVGLRRGLDLAARGAALTIPVSLLLG